MHFLAQATKTEKKDMEITFDVNDKGAQLKQANIVTARIVCHGCNRMMSWTTKFYTPFLAPFPVF